jgi:hypothetical protein
MIKNFIQVEPHRVTQMQICPVHHGSKTGIPHTQFAGNAGISVTSQGLFHSSSIQLYCASLTLPNYVFQHLFVLLQKPTAAVIAQNAKEHVLVVCEMSHTLDDINVCMLRPLARCVFRPPPYYNLTNFVHNAVCLFKVPAFRPANSVRQMSLEQFKQRHALPVQFLQVTYRDVPPPAQHIPFQSFDKYLCDLVAWVHYRRHIEQGGSSVPGRGADLLVKVIYLVYTT